MYFSTMALTITNPATILVFIGLFSGISGVSNSAQNDAIALVAGVGAASALWWLTLSQLPPGWDATSPRRGCCGSTDSQESSFLALELPHYGVASYE
jgi:hypothetical protein